MKFSMCICNFWSLNDSDPTQVSLINTKLFEPYEKTAPFGAVGMLGGHAEEVARPWAGAACC